MKSEKHAVMVLAPLDATMYSSRLPTAFANVQVLLRVNVPTKERKHEHMYAHSVHVK